MDDIDDGSEGVGYLDGDSLGIVYLDYDSMGPPDTTRTLQ